MVVAENILNEQHNVLLDISLFVLDMLSPERIKDKYSRKDDGVILEVPSAFITMIIDAQAGNLLLKEFIDVHLSSIKNNPLHTSSKDSKIQAIVNSTNETFENLKDKAYQTILSEFAPLIKDISKVDQIEKESNKTELEDYPIKVYEPIEPVSQDELRSLRASYLQELKLIPHPLYDLYFLQIFHAQTSGFLKKREFLSAGRATHKTIKLWKESLFKKVTENHITPEVARNKVDNKDEDNSLDFLRYLITNYFRKDWQGLVTDAIGVGVDVSLTAAQTGTLSWNDLAIKVVTLKGVKLISKAITEPNIPVDQRIGYMSLGLLLLLIVCFVSGGIVYISQLLSSEDDENKVVFPQIILSITPIANPTLIVFPTPTVIPVNTIEIVPFTATSTLEVITFQNENQSPNYCMYVIQAGDNLQSVASFFKVSENQIKSENPLVADNVFIANQLIKINTSCCTAINNNGFSYSVLPNDDLYSLATKFSTSVEAISSANNLAIPQYIQTGQMLCIPYP